MNIDRKIGAIHLKGSADLKETRITGLSHVQRVGDAVLKNENGSFAAKLHLGDNNVKLVIWILALFENKIFNKIQNVVLKQGYMGLALVFF